MRLERICINPKGSGQESPECIPAGMTVLAEVPCQSEYNLCNIYSVND